MAQAGFTPIQLYYSTTAAATPAAVDLAAGELAINTNDEKLYFKNSSGTVKLLASSTGASGSVTTVSVVSANGLAGTVANATTTPAITLSTTVSGLLKGNGTAISAAVSGTDYAPATSGSSILYGNGSGGFSNVTIGSGISFAGGTLSATGSGGTVTGVTASSPLASSGGATPNISFTGTLAVANGGTGTSTAFTAGSVVFAGASGVYSQSNANFYFDSVNTRLGIGTNTPAATLTITNSGVLAWPNASNNYNGTTTGASILKFSDNSLYIDNVDASTSIIFRRNGPTETARFTPDGGFSVGTASDPGAGAIYATGNITAYFSDDRLKTRLGKIENALDKIDQLNGFYYEPNSTAQALGYKAKREVGVSAQEVQAVLPEIVAPAPVDEKYMTIHYDRLVPLLIEAVKELRAEVKVLKEAQR